MRARAMRWAAGTAIIVAGAAAPVEWANGRFIVSDACADGTCCPEPKSDCIINNIVALDHYRKAGAGPCGGNPTQPLPPP